MMWMMNIVLVQCYSLNRKNIPGAVFYRRAIEAKMEMQDTSEKIEVFFLHDR